jgi:hypothetical protein
MGSLVWREIMEMKNLNEGNGKKKGGAQKPFMPDATGVVTSKICESKCKEELTRDDIWIAEYTLHEVDHLYTGAIVENWHETLTQKDIETVAKAIKNQAIGNDHIDEKLKNMLRKRMVEVGHSARVNNMDKGIVLDIAKCMCSKQIPKCISKFIGNEKYDTDVEEGVWLLRDIITIAEYTKNENAVIAAVDCVAKFEDKDVAKKIASLMSGTAYCMCNTPKAAGEALIVMANCIAEHSEDLKEAMAITRMFYDFFMFSGITEAEATKKVEASKELSDSAGVMVRGIIKVINEEMD